jgi:hypothetical protein
MMVSMLAYQPTTEDLRGPVRPVPNVPLFANPGWTTRVRLNGHTLTPAAGHPITPLVTGRSTRPRAKVSLGARGILTVTAGTPEQIGAAMR